MSSHLRDAEIRTSVRTGIATLTEASNLMIGDDRPNIQRLGFLLRRMLDSIIQLQEYLRQDTR